MLEGKVNGRFNEDRNYLQHHGVVEILTEALTRQEFLVRNGLESPPTIFAPLEPTQANPMFYVESRWESVRDEKSSLYVRIWPSRREEGLKGRRRLVIVARDTYRFIPSKAAIMRVRILSACDHPATVSYPGSAQEIEIE